MNPNARNLAMRDPALAAFFGLAADDFGTESTFAGDEYGSDFGGDFGAEFGEDEMGLVVPINQAFGQGPMLPGGAMPIVSDPRHPASPVNPANIGTTMALWQQHLTKQNYTKRREALLDPNGDSTTKVERYSFTLAAAIVLSTAGALNAQDSPATKIRPQRVIMNAPAPGFVTVAELKVSNVSVTSGAAEDAFGYSAQAVGAHLDMPTLTPSNKATFLGNYTGFVPPGYVALAAYSFTIAFRGPATLAGG